MPKVGVSNEPLLERLVFAYDGTDYRVVKCDTSGNVVAALNAGSTIAVTQATPASLQAAVNVNAGQTIAVTQATAASLKAEATLAADQNVQARGYGWDGAAWQKQNLLFGVNDSIAERVSNTNLSAGTNSLSTTVVPAGVVHIYTVVASVYIGTVPTLLRHYVNIGGTGYNFFRVKSPVSETLYDKQVNLVLAAGDYLQCFVDGATAGDDLYFDVMGYKFLVA